MAKTATDRKFKLSQKGQLTIFFSVTLVTLITIIAFIVNVGLYVKAKINLQNATDAAAWSGAAVQARQLTTIGYLNWEMRNIYKEWMFKYYILGNMSVNGVINPDSNGGDAVDFTMEKRPRGTKEDIYNFPSVCIHFFGSTNVCKRYEIPGLPRFTNTNLPGLDEQSAQFLDSVVTKKAEDCARRTQMNFLAALSWIYGVQGASTDTLANAAPQIATDRPGAWPSAFELAIRIRNLEKVMNTHKLQGKDFNTGVCSSPSYSKGLKCGVPIDRIMSTSQPHYERTSKAFFAAFRNLGNEDDDEMKGSFVLTELTPKSVRNPGQYSLSNLLISKSPDYEKTYVDLRLVTLNLINFYSSFVATDDDSLGDTKSEGGCFVSKIGIPVPGYPMGFEKSPDLVTYYAVKGEANFIGLFNPFRTATSYTKLTAYAAAKPFGGRIGPKLFDTRTSETMVYGRNNPPKSAAYISGLQFPRSGDYETGDPIPTSNNFWVQDPINPIGGWLPGSEVRFGLPNMIYENTPDMAKHMGSDKIQIIKPDNPAQNPNIGLFDPAQLKALKANFPSFGGNNPVTNTDITNAILNVRAPTHYDSQNYLIPYPNEMWQGLGVDSFGFVTGTTGPRNTYNLNAFAPLYVPGGGYLYDSPGDIIGVLQEYINTQKGAVDMYVGALKKVADDMRFKNKSAEGLYFKASKVINDEYNGKPLTCSSIAGTFSYFLLGEQSGLAASGCPKPFPEELEEAWGSGKTVNGDQFHYKSEFKYNETLAVEKKPLNFFTAYSPGVFHGATDKAKVSNKFLGTNELMRRNFYSTKLIAVKSVSGRGGTQFNESQQFPIFSEGNLSANVQDTKQKSFKNPIDTAAAGVDLSKIEN